ncbi:MAG TPA: CocE/NonD family hydrolase [Steroidobacteraceae bacterium]|nr:CocE/NonD family hydrolase [Steroidobacteraceae bacterium]
MTWRTMIRLVLLGSVALAPGAACASGLYSDADPAKLSQPAYKVIVEHNVRIPMGDGITLSADIYRPGDAGRFPALLLRTPYSNNSPDEIQDSQWYAERGYVVVNEDVRGRYDSDGQFYTYRNEASDGYDTDEWIAKQPWSDGKIGTLGGSYLGYTQLTQGIRGSSHLASMATEVTSTDIYDGWAYVDGAFVLGFALPWGAGIIDGRTIQMGTYDWPTIFRHLPLSTADAAAGHVNFPYRDWVQHARREDPYWEGISFERQAQHIGVPLLVVEGWYDIFLRGALRDHERITTAGATELARQNKRLVIGPWIHFKNHAPRIDSAPDPSDPGIDFGPDAAIDMRQVYLRWHDHWLKGIDNGVEREPPVSLFVMGVNRWRNEKEWPLARTRYTNYYLHSGGHANSAGGDGTLATTGPTGPATDTFTYDPASPVPTLGGNVCCSSVPNGPHDQRPVEARSDVLVYTTPALREPLEVTGPIRVKLFAASSAADTDWTAKLVDVHPDGYAQNLQDGIVRARYRRGKDQPAALLEPGRVYEYDIDLWATSNTFLPGHRLRVEIASSNFPRFDRNLNTGEDPATGTRLQLARQTIYHSAKYPSHIVLPVIPADSHPTG